MDSSTFTLICRTKQLITRSDFKVKMHKTAFALHNSSTWINGIEGFPIVIVWLHASLCYYIVVCVCSQMLPLMILTVIMIPVMMKMIKHLLINVHVECACTLTMSPTTNTPLSGNACLSSSVCLSQWCKL